MTEYWYSDPETGVKTMFTANSEEEANAKWQEFMHLSKARLVEDFENSK